MDSELRANLQAAAQVLYHALYREPKLDFLRTLQGAGAARSWPDYAQNATQKQALVQLERALSQPTEALLAQLKPDFAALFIGPGPLKAIPWGSPYLHEKRLLCGPSTQALMQWYRHHGIEVNSDSNEPLDHIGLLLSVIALLVSDPGKDPVLTELLRDHLLPWSGRMLSLMQTQAQTDYYQAIAGLTQALLDTLSNALAITTPEVRLYA
ncbi:TorD/DmsD family molecular chaperone [Ferrimonas pelagia]|uniref:Molecular chaperone TorD family protein n=1 Tax=Ferrimonas pelagia TaxID=1177826 RepID=A0ABP9EBX1_9GAMM